MKNTFLMLVLLLVACGPSKEELDVVKHDKQQIAAQLTECKAQLNARARVITGAYHGSATLVKTHCDTIIVGLGCKGDLNMGIGKTSNWTIYLTEKSEWVYFGLDESCKGRRFNDEVSANCERSFVSTFYHLRFEDGALYGQITEVLNSNAAILTHEYTFTSKK